MDIQLLLLRRGPRGIGTRNKNHRFFNKQANKQASLQASASVQFLFFLLLSVTSFNTTLIPSPQYELLKTPKPFQSLKPFCL